MAQNQVFRGVARHIVRTECGETRFYYHNTAVVTTDATHISLHSGGWRTATTKLAMNQVSNQYRLGFNVFQEDHVWYVQYHCGGDWRIDEFYDGITFTR